MVSLTNDYSTFLNLILMSCTSFLNWLIDTVLGDMYIFIVIIAIFMAIVEYLIIIKNR